MATESETKEFNVPEALVFGWSFLNTTEYIVDRVPEFQSVSGARRGGKLVAAVEVAMASEPHIVSWPTDLWQIVCRCIASDSFQLPRNYFVNKGKPTDQLVPLRSYLPHFEAILAAKDPEAAAAAPAT